MITFFRRRGLGAGSCRGMARFIDGVPYGTPVSVREYIGTNCSVIRNDRELSDTDLLVRWGCTSHTSIPLARQVNTSEAIHFVANKAASRMYLQQHGDGLVPFTTGAEEEVDRPMVLRPSYHHQGKNLWVVSSAGELNTVLNTYPNVFTDGWYASELIHKVAEYRVYVASGRVVTVARKTPDDPSQVAWNVAQGGRFDVVPWGAWPLEACRVAVEAFNLIPGLDFSGVDVMLDGDGRAYVIELNSAPSLPSLSDGSVSYRQKCMARVFKWVEKEGKERMDIKRNQGWAGYIHPAIGG